MRGIHRLAGVAGRLHANYRQFAAGILVLGSIALVVLGRVEPRTVQTIEAQLIDIMAATVSAVNVPVEGLGMLIRDFDELVHARKENQQLKTLVQQLQIQVNSMARAESENHKLRELLALVPVQVPTYLSVEVIASGTAVPRHSLVISGGTRDGIAPGDAVVSLDRMVGYVTVAGRHASRVQLLTSLASHVPVFGEHSGQGAVVTGGSGGVLQFAYLGASPSTAGFRDREALFTSGQGGMFPANLLVGRIERDESGVRVRPAVDIDGLRILQVIPHQPVEVVPAEQLL